MKMSNEKFMHIVENINGFMKTKANTYLYKKLEGNQFNFFVCADQHCPCFYIRAHSRVNKVDLCDNCPEFNARYMNCRSKAAQKYFELRDYIDQLAVECYKNVPKEYYIDNGVIDYSYLSILLFRTFPKLLFLLKNTAAMEKEKKKLKKSKKDELEDEE